MKYLYLFLAITLIIVISLFSLNYWQDRYPLLLEFYDIAYHGNNAVGLERAGGFTLINFWAGVKENTPNTYFPFFQILGLLTLSKGLSVFFLTYWVNWLFLPLSFFALLLFAYKAYGATIGLYSVTLLSLSPVWMEKQWGMPPQALVYVLTPLIFLALVKKRYIITMLLTLCCMATHFTGILLFPFIFLYALQNSNQRKALFIILGVILLLGSPFIWFMLQRIRHAGLPIVLMAAPLEAIKTSLFRLFDVRGSMHVYLGWLAAAGLAVCYFKKKEFLILPSYFLTFFPLAWTTQDIRFWGAPALFIFALLGGVTLGSLHSRIEKIKFGKLIGVAFFVVIFLAGHWFFYHASSWSEQVRTPTLLYLKSPNIWQHPKLTFSMEDREKITKLVKEKVEPDEFFWIDSSHNINNHIAFESRRSAVKSISFEENAMTLVKGIKLAVAKKSPSDDYTMLDKINDEYNAYILADPSNAAKFTLPKPLIKTRQLEMIFLAIGLLILADIFNLPYRKWRIL